jgi:hypothetical protein
VGQVQKIIDPATQRSKFDQNTVNRPTLIDDCLKLPPSDLILSEIACASHPGGKQHVSFKATAENSKFTQQLIVDVGDVPDHIVRAFEIRFTYPNNAPVISGLKLAETWGRGITDYIDGNGSATVYIVIAMENGDRVFARVTGVASKTSERLAATQVGYITGGTGKLAGCRELYEYHPTSIIKRASMRANSTVDYSIGK